MRFVSRAVPVLLLVIVVGCSEGNSESGGGGEQGVILLRYKQGSESTEQRERGFLETLEKEFPQIHVLSSDQYSGATAGESLDKAQQLLIKYRTRTTGMFAVCEPNATGCLGALQQEGLVGKVKLVGMDPTARMIQALRDGKLHGIVLQDPVAMGYLAVKTMVAHLDGQPVEPRVPTGEYMATAENMDEPRMKELLAPIQFTEPHVPSNKKYSVAVIPKGTTHEFWKSVHAGAEKAARELDNVEVLWKGPISEADIQGQINIVQDFVTRQVDGIVLAPNSSQALVNVVKEARQQGIPTVIFDSGLDDPDITVSYVATDNYQAGVLAARRLAEVLGMKAELPANGEETATP